jgi:hypothetical protein
VKLISALAVLGVACAGAPVSPLVAAATPVKIAAPSLEEPGPVAGAQPLEGNLATGRSRPSDVKALRFDVGALPVAIWGRPNKRAGYWLRENRDEFKVTIRGPYFAEVNIRRPTSWFTVFTGGSFGVGDPPRCGPGHRDSTVTYWTGISARGWTDTGVDVEMGRGNFEASICAGVPLVLLEARAAAIVPGYVYGLRVETPPTPLEPGDEQLVVFLPRGQLVAAGGDPSFPLGTTNTGPFTRLTLPSNPGSAGSASVRVSAASIDLWTKLRSTGRPVWSFNDEAAVDDDVLVGVDVVSQGTTRLGSVLVSVPPGPVRRFSYAGLLEAVDQLASPEESHLASAGR